MIAKYLALLTLAPMWVSASAAAYFSAGPATSRFPDNMSSENLSEALPLEYGYKHGFTEDGWTVEAVGSSSYSFVCPSYTGSSEALNALLTTNPFMVAENGAWLRWSARSVLPGFPEAYDIVVTLADSGERVIIAEIEAEDSEWNTRLVPLDDFVGKEIAVSFVCRSVNKYMLAVRDIFAGVMEDTKFEIDDTTRRYAAVSDGATATGVITNVGATLSDVSIVCRVGEDEVSSEINGVWLTGESIEYALPLPVSLNEATSYSIGIKDKDGKFTELASSDVFASYFARTLLVDEGTGMWCNNCPDGILELQRLKREYGDNIIELCCHTNDLLEMPDYWKHLEFYAVPYMMLNRNRQTVGGSSRYFSREYFAPTIAEIVMPKVVVADDKSVKMDVSSRFAEDIDNSDGRYSIGYTVVADIYSPASQYYQENNLTFPRGEQYYILPSFILPTLARFESVVIDDSHSFSGIEGSLPSQISAQEVYASSFTVTLPEIADSAEEVWVVAYVSDTATGEILNAASSTVTLTNGVGSVYDLGSDNISIKMLPSGACMVEGVDNQEIIDISVSDSQGRILDRFKGTRSQIADRKFAYPRGLAVITAYTGRGSAVAKYISIN